ncbi:Fe-S-containing hydro-lyase [Candidatus Atribacteria bacterium 1244-E10-H5-B2]|jgi:fumarate hydratase subunit beta|nr:MAG: Fe-S-containing hydro-lyase [Candidatus Atribacteria bacterium 1244-E10-H5-B2]
MTDIKKVTTPLDDEVIINLRAGDSVSITGYIYTGRDAAHKRLVELIENGQELPIKLKGQIIYYVGPAPAKPGYPCGSAGPTTSYRMDPYTPALLDRGLKGMIGKGLRSQEVIESMKKNKVVYFGAVGGAAALIARSIKKAEVIAYEDLGTEAIYQFYVEDFPAIVVIDAYGNNLYETEPPKYRK